MPTAASGAMGLVIHGKVEFSAGSKQFPDGKNRDYGYWRSSLHESTKSKFDNDLWIYIERKKNKKYSVKIRKKKNIC